MDRQGGECGGKRVRVLASSPVVHFVFSYRIIQLIMIGKPHQKTQLPSQGPQEAAHSPSKSVKHSLASTALSHSTAASLLSPLDPVQRPQEHPPNDTPLTRALSSSSIVETAVRAFDQLARKNQKSHLLKKYAELKEKYCKIMENSTYRPRDRNQRSPKSNPQTDRLLQCEEGDNITQNKQKNLEAKFKEQQRDPSARECIQFQSERGRQVFVVVRYLSEGASGKVYLVRHAATGCVFSLKVIPRSSIGALNLHQLIRELKIQSFLSHPNVVRLYHHHVDARAVYLLLEPCLGGDLFACLRGREGLEERRVKEVARQVCQAVEHMHRRHIIHRDIKPENILLHEGVVKICDFGWAVHSPLLRETRCGTPLYASPEMVRAEQYDCKIDVWNIGILTYELLHGNIPFEIRQLADLTKIIEQEVYFSQRLPLSEYAKDFISGCLQKHPAQRFTIRQAVEHEFLANLEKFRWTVV